MQLEGEELPPLRDTLERAELHRFSFQIPPGQRPNQSFTITNPHADADWTGRTQIQWVCLRQRQDAVDIGPNACS